MPEGTLEAAGGDLDLPTLCGVQAPALFYADDLDLVSTSVRGLQAQLELLESFCTRWRPTVNVKKTKGQHHICTRMLFYIMLLGVLCLCFGLFYLCMSLPLEPLHEP